MVEALSGGRWQGSSTADIPTVSTLNATNGTTNWSADTSKLTKSGNTITFSATGTSNDEEIYYDLTSTSDDKWTLRFKADFTSIGAGNNAQHQQLQFGIYDSTNPSGNASGDAIMFYLSSAGNVSNAVNGVNGGTSDITSTNNTPIASSGSAVTYYIELQRTSSSAIQAKVFSDEYVTQVGSTLSKTGLSGITGLRYLMVRLWSEGGAGNGAVGSVTDIKLYNNKSSTTTDEKTTLTNVPANTRYEEYDTRKIYRRVVSSSIGTTKAGATADSNSNITYLTYKQITGLTSGDIITAVTFDAYSYSSTAFKGGVYTDSSNQPSSLLGSGTLASGSLSNTYTTTSITLDSPVTVPSDGKVWVAIVPSTNSPNLRNTTEGSGAYTHSVYATSSSPSGSYTNYANMLYSTANISGNGTNNVRFGVTTGSVWKERNTA